MNQAPEPVRGGEAMSEAAIEELEEAIVDVLATMTDGLPSRLAMRNAADNLFALQQAREHLVHDLVNQWGEEL